MFKSFFSSFSSFIGKKVIKGTQDSDTIVGPASNDIIKGKGGNDFLNGGNGDDIVLGGAGDDDLGGGSGRDIVYGGSGDDNLRGGGGKDLLIGGSGDDRLVGASFDKLWGGKGADEFRIDATGDKNTILDFDFREGDRIDIPPGYSLDNADIVDNGFSLFGVTVTFYDSHGAAGPVVQINGVGKPSDVMDDWFI